MTLSQPISISHFMSFFQKLCTSTILGLLHCWSLYPLQHIYCIWFYVLLSKTVYIYFLWFIQNIYCSISNNLVKLLYKKYTVLILFLIDVVICYLYYSSLNPLQQEYIYCLQTYFYISLYVLLSKTVYIYYFGFATLLVLISPPAHILSATLILFQLQNIYTRH
jgi:hypothetical protein